MKNFIFVLLVKQKAIASEQGVVKDIIMTEHLLWVTFKWGNDSKHFDQTQIFTYCKWSVGMAKW